MKLGRSCSLNNSVCFSLSSLVKGFFFLIFLAQRKGKAFQSTAWVSFSAVGGSYGRCPGLREGVELWWALGFSLAFFQKPHLLENRKWGNTGPFPSWVVVVFFFFWCSKLKSVWWQWNCGAESWSKSDFLFSCFKRFTGAWTILSKGLVYLLLYAWTSFM